MSVCRYCGNIEENPGKYCMRCGKLLQQTSYCMRCGSPLKPEHKFCSSCGAPVEEVIKNSTAPTILNGENPIVEEPYHLDQLELQDDNKQPRSDFEGNLDEPIGNREYLEEKDWNNNITTEYPDNHPEENGISSEYYQTPEESSNKTKVWIGVILAAIITGGGIWGYKAYIGNSAGDEQVEAASTQEDSTDQNTPIAIIRSSGSETFRLFDLDGEPFGPTIDWEIDWPEGGEASIRNKIKAEIIRMLELKMPNGKTVDNVTPEELFQETVKRYKEEYEEFKTPAQYEEARGAVFWCDGEECEATIEIWDDALINITTHSTPNIMNGTPYTQTLNELILLETGESWKPSLLPSDSQILPLVIKQWVRLGYPQDAVSAAGNALLDVDSRYWTKEGLTFFYWKPWGLDIPDVDWMVEVTIPYRELLPVLSSDAKRFIMPSILE